MNLILDTHILLWFLGGDPRLSHRARAAIEDLSNRRFFSIAGAWEIAIKVSLDHIAGLIGLPLHHRDPFDRILVTQAMVEHAVLISADPALDQYPPQRIW